MKYWIERFTNRVTMEKLVLYCLLAVVITSLVLSALGIISYSPLAIISSVIVLVFVSYGCNLLLGYLFGVAISYESPVITALILSLILPPAFDLLGISVLALTAVVAMASKFVLTIRGRHIFNPAAIAAVIVGLTGLQYATWWVATPPLLPVVLIGAFLVLYKTRHLLMGSVFIMIAASVIVTLGMIDGYSIVTMFSTVLFSWPLIFFAGYMLSEPLTLPPRRWQKIALAGLAGIGIALPFHIGGVASSPEIVLVLINAIAFFLGQRRGVRLTFDGIRELSPTVREFSLTSKHPILFQPGQYLELHVPQKKPDSKGSRRSFSIVGVPGDATISIATKLPENSSTYKKALADLKVGTTLPVTRVSGDFVLPKDTKEPITFIAGGIGITPFVSHIRSMMKTGEVRDITLLYSVSQTNELAYIQDFIDAGVKIVVITDNVLSKIEGVKYITQSYITSQVLIEAGLGINKTQVYLSGPPLMVDSVNVALKKLGCRHIHRDYFNGY